MKLAVIFLLAGLHVCAGSASQTVTFRGKGEVLRKAFHAIEEQTGFLVFYSKNLLARQVPVELDVRNMPLQQFLDLALAKQPLKYVIENKTILVSARPGAAAPAGNVVNALQNAPPIRIAGTVTDTAGTPLPGATIAVKGTRNIVLSDADGHFSIQANTGDILVFSYVGFESREVKAGPLTTLRIALKLKSASMMEDVAVVNNGYRRLSHRELASAVVQLNMKDIELASRFSVDQMLTGQASGVNVLQTSGEPGATPTIRIRGTSSIIGGSAPLWVLDGIILEDMVNVDVSNLNSPDAQYLVGNAIAGINARDIETITILKDASATAIYGSRAANGVIVVTTKKGRAGKPQINYSGSLSINERVSYKELGLMNAGERMKLSQEIIEDNIEFSRVPRRLGYEGLYLAYLDKEISYDEFAAGVKEMAERNTDWYDILFRNSVTNNHSVNISGGSDRTTYYASLGYSDVLGSAKGSDQKRYSAMLKVNSWKTEKLFMGLQVNASNSKGSGFHASVNPNQYAYQTSRTLPAYENDGSLFFYLTQQKSQEFPAISAPKEDMLYNIINETQLTGASSNISSITAQVNLEYRFLKGFSYRLLGGFDQGISNTSSWAEERSNFVSTRRLWNAGVLVPGTDDFNNSSIPWGGILNNSDQRKTAYTLRNSIEFSRMLSGHHLVSLTATQELRSLKYKGLSGTYYGWQPERGNTISPAITPAYTGLLSSLRPLITDNISNSLSWLGTATYSYKDKITINGNIRSDGSNNFGDNPRYRFLPIWSLAAKYTLTNEPFMDRIPVLSYFALRGSYGIQGNIDRASSPDLIIRVGARDAITGLNESYYQFLANPYLRWEKTNSYNLGLEFALFGRSGQRSLDVISGTVDIYEKRGTDIIVSRKVSQVLGLDQVRVNGGKVNNKGIEGTLQVVPYQTRDFSASVRFIASYNRNTLVEANREIDITNDNKLNGNALVEGKPVGSFYSYRYAGLNETSGYPMFYNNKGEKKYQLYPDEIDLVYSGVRLPEVSGGFNVNLRYKGWYAALGFQYAVGGVDRLPNFYRANYYDVFDALANTSKELNNRWRKPGDEQLTNIPVLYDNDKFQEANKALNVPVQLTAVPKTPLNMYDLSDIRTAGTDNLRMRNVNLSYVFPAPKLRRTGLETLSISFQTENLFLVADKAWQGRDPETGGSNTPLPKVYTLSINAGF